MAMGMARFALCLLTMTLLAAGGLAQPPGPAPADLGLKVTAVPEALYAHVPALEHGHGLLVETIKPGSRAAELGLKPYDIVLAVGTAPVKSGDELQRKLRSLP